MIGVLGALSAGFDCRLYVYSDDALRNPPLHSVWNQFRGPGGDGIDRSGGELPLDWSKEDARWRTPLPGSGWSSPVLSEREIILTAAASQPSDEQSLDLITLWIDRESGEVVRRLKVFFQEGDDQPRIHSKNSHASPTPLLIGPDILVHFGYQGTALLAPDGALRWANRDLRFPPVHGNGGSPIVVGGRVIFTCDGEEQPSIAALDLASGRLVWRRNRPVNAERKFSFCTPTVIEVDGKSQVVCPGSDCVLSLDPQSGEILWQVRYEGYSVVPKPVFADGLVFVATGYGDTRLLAIDPRGIGDVTDSHVVWTLERGAPNTPSLLAHQQRLYVLSDDGILTVLRTTSGELVYRQRLGGNYSASPIEVAGKLVLTSEEGKVTILNGGEQFQVLAEKDLGERTLASPAYGEGSLYFRTAEALYRFD